MLTLAAGLGLGLAAGEARAHAPARSNAAGYYYRPGGYRYVYRTPRVARPAAHVSTNDWSTGRSNFPIPLTKPWMSPNRY